MEGFTVKADNYVSKYHFLSSSFFRFDRVHRFDKSAIDLDVLPNMWTLAIGNIPKEILSVPGHESDLAIEGSAAVFIPPFSPIQWKISPGVLEFTGFLSTKELPSDLPRQPILFTWPVAKDPRSEEDIFQVIRNLKTFNYIYPPGRYSKVSELTKKYLDANYHNRFNIAELPKVLNYSHSFITRSFKATYGVSPLEYRTKLRLFDAQMLLLLKNLKVSTVVYASGFSDPGRFLKRFRQMFHAKPSQFKAVDGGFDNSPLL